MGIVIPAMPELKFDKATHQYTVNGQAVPSVTQLMEPLTAKEYGSIDESVLSKAAKRGTEVHSAIELWIKFEFMDTSSESEGYVQAFMDWYKQHSPEVIGSEVRVYHKLYMYAGTVDMLAMIDGELNLIDFKTTSKMIDKNHRVQLEGYAKALESHGITVLRKRILQLSKDGKYRDVEYPAKDAEAWRVFGSLKCIYDYGK